MAEADAGQRQGAGRWIRSDVASVRPLGGYPARSCPVKTQWDVLKPAAPAEPTEVLAVRFREGNEFEDRIFASLLHEHADDVAIIDASVDQATSEKTTMDAMDAGMKVILGGRLPTDHAGRRVGEPDLLVRAAEPAVDGRWGYYPADVKHHRALTGDGALVVARPTNDVAPPDASDEMTPSGQREGRRGDLLQVAHYWRMLEGIGRAPAGRPWAGILGREERLVWYPLDEPMWTTPAKSGGKKTKRRATLEVYDFEFAFRLDIAAAAEAHRADPTIPLLVQPVRISECDSCRWRNHCLGILEERHDVSLLPRVGWREWRLHQEHGVTNIEQLAQLDLRTADLVAQVDVAHLLRAASEAAADTPIDDLLKGRRAQLRVLHEAGAHTVGDLAGLDPATAAYSDEKPSGLRSHIEQARARTGQAAVYRRPGVDSIIVPRADVEVDIDMENTPGDAVYLWGLLVHDHSGLLGGVTGYRPFVSWSRALAPEEEVHVFVDFWAHLSELRRRSNDRGGTFAAYCWNAAAENRRLRDLGTRAGCLDEVAEFIHSASWVDLLRVFSSQLVTGHSSGLKAVAPLAGFFWRDDDPGGAQSMLWWDDATRQDDARVAEAARQRLLHYNEDDVMATAAIREWLDEAEVIPLLPKP